MSGEVVALLI